jgi:hypothetical protein
MAFGVKQEETLIRSNRGISTSTQHTDGDGSDGWRTLILLILCI